MKSRSLRRIIAYIFILAFLVTAPILVIYTSGYRYNFHRHRLEKVGIFSIETEPEKADIYINGQKASKQTEAILKNFFPGQYNVKLTKAGYHDWQKQLPIEPGLTTFIKNVLLFKQSEPQVFIEAPISQVFASPNNEKFIYSLAEEPPAVWLYDLNQKKSVFLNQLNDKQSLAEVIWLEENIIEKLTTNGQISYRMINLNQPFIDNQPINQLLDQFSKIKPYKNQQLIGLKEKTFYLIDSEEPTALQLMKINKPVIDFIIHYDRLFFVNYEQKYSYLKFFEIKHKEKFFTTAQLPRSDDYKFIRKSPWPFVTLINNQTSGLYVITPEEDLISSQTKQINNVKSASWYPDKRKLLIIKDFEINIYYPDSCYLQLINRYGSLIEKAVFHNQGDYIFFVNQDSLKVIEIDDFEGRHLINLTKADNLNSLFIDPSGQKLYFLADQTENQQKLFELDIH